MQRPCLCGDSRDVVPLEHPIRGQHRQIFQLRLGNEETVERIAMVRRQDRYLQGVSVFNGQRQNAECSHPTGYVRHRRLG